MLSRNRNAKYFSMTGRHLAEHNTKGSFAFSVVRNFLNKVYLNHYMSSLLLATLSEWCVYLFRNEC